MRDLPTSVFDLILGRSCAGCDQPGNVLCSSCRAQLRPALRVRRDLNLNDVVEGLRIPVVCALDYRGVARQVLFRYKDHRIRQLADYLAPALSASIRFAAEHACVPIGSALLTPLPTRRASVRRRGFDATGHLLRRAAASSQAIGIRPLLTDVRTTRGSKNLGMHERERSAIEAFRLRSEGRLPRSPVIVVDDIVTTGATAREAVTMLVLAGVHVAAVATVAGTP